VDLVCEELVEQQVLQVVVLFEGLSDVAQEAGTNDTAAAPHQRAAAIIEVPVVLRGSLLQQHEALGIGYDFRGVQGLADGLDEGGLVAGELGVGGTFQYFAGLCSFGEQRGQAASEHGLANQSQWDAEVERFDGGPFAGAFLSG